MKRVRDMIRTYGPTVNWKLFSGHFIKAAMIAHVPSITKYACVEISNNFSLTVAWHSRNQKTECAGIPLQIPRSAYVLN